MANFPIVISIDNKNSVRVSSLEKMQCLQVWKLEDNFHPRIFIFKSIPYVALYDKLIHYYKIHREQDFQIVNNRKGPSAEDEIVSSNVLGVDYCNYYDCLLVLL